MMGPFAPQAILYAICGGCGHRLKKSKFCAYFPMILYQNHVFRTRFRFDNLHKSTFEASVAAILSHFAKFHTLLAVVARGGVLILRK